jgi:hypothetical protein
LLGFFAWTGLAAVGLSHLTFPRYALMPLAALIALGVGLVIHTSEQFDARGHRRVATAIALAAIVTLAWPATDILRLLASAHAGRTELIASQTTARLNGRIVAEPYTLPYTDPVEHMSNLATHPELLTCHCYLVISSYAEERYRAEPLRYPQEVAVYDRIRRLGTTVSVTRPSVPLTYRWEALPDYGIRAVPLDRPAVVGPIITVVKMP